MIGAPNTRGQKYWVGIVQWAPETLVSEEIADFFRDYNIDAEFIVGNTNVNLHIILYFDTETRHSGPRLNIRKDVFS